jgi:hypothetical protein
MILENYLNPWKEKTTTDLQLFEIIYKVSWRFTQKIGTTGIKKFCHLIQFLKHH